MAVELLKGNPCYFIYTDCLLFKNFLLTRLYFNVTIPNYMIMIEDHLILEMLDWAGLSFPLSVPIFLKPPVPYFERYYLYLKIAAFINQDGRCICGAPFYKPELHHAIISRGNVVKAKYPEVIHHPHNVILLNPDCHKNISRGEALEFLIKIYGEKEVKSSIEQIRRSN